MNQQTVTFLLAAILVFIKNSSANCGCGPICCGGDDFDNGFGDRDFDDVNNDDCGCCAPQVKYLPVPKPFPIRVPVPRPCPPPPSVTIPNIIMALLPPTSNKNRCEVPRCGCSRRFDNDRCCDNFGRFRDGLDCGCGFGGIRRGAFDCGCGFGGIRRGAFDCGCGFGGIRRGLGRSCGFGCGFCRRPCRPCPLVVPYPVPKPCIIPTPTCCCC